MDWTRKTNAKGYVYEINARGDRRWVQDAAASISVGAKPSQTHSPPPSSAARWELCQDENGYGYYTNGDLSYWESDKSIWTELQDHDGHTYYVNNLTGESVWSRPTYDEDSSATEPQVETAADTPLQQHPAHSSNARAKDPSEAASNIPQNKQNPEANIEQETRSSFSLGSLVSATTQCK